jgi:hypothetical protein
MKNGVEELKPIFADRSDLLFRHFENCNVTTMRWHCGRNVTEIVNLPDGKGKQLDAQGCLPQERRRCLGAPRASEKLIRVYRKPRTRLMNRARRPFAGLRACVKQKAATR